MALINIVNDCLKELGKQDVENCKQRIVCEAQNEIFAIQNNPYLSDEEKFYKTNRTPYLDTEEISKEDFMGYKLHSLTNDAKWFSHDGSTLSQSFLNEYNQAIPELREFCNEKEFDGLQQIVVGLKIRDIKRTQSSNEEKTKDPYEEKAKIITKGDRRIPNPNKPRIKRVTPAVNREEIKQQNALNHCNNLRKYYGK